MGKFKNDLQEEFGSGLEGQFGDKKPKATTIRDTAKPLGKKDKIVTEPGEGRVTVVMEDLIHEKLKRMSYHDRSTIKEIVHEALKKAILAYEKKNGELLPIPIDKTRKNQARKY